MLTIGMFCRRGDYDFPYQYPSKIAQKLGIGGKNRIMKDDTDAEITDTKNILTTTGSRYYRKENVTIKKSVEGS